MRVYCWLVSAFLLFPFAVMAQFPSAQSDSGTRNDTSGGVMDGAGDVAGYGAGWWFWTLLLLAILLTIVWWAIRAGNTQKRSKSKQTR